MAHQLSMIIGNALHYQQGMNRSTALKTAWAMIRQGEFHTKVAGTTYGLQQTALLRLKRYSQQAITVTLVPEPNNQADPLAVAVVVTVTGKGSFKLATCPGKQRPYGPH